MRVLLIEDNVELCEALRPVLERAGFSADACHHGEDGLQMLCQGQDAPGGNVYDACLLDRMLPGMDGLTLLRTARARGITTPVLMLTALGRVGDRVDGLDAGADDYLAKPFDNRELLARLRALTRRPAAASGSTGLYLCGDLRLDAAELTLAGPKASVTLSKKESELLEALCRQPGRLQSRAVLLGRVWGQLSEVEEANLDSYIHFIRRRLKAVGSAVQVLTVRGAGYKLEVPPC